MKKNLLFTALLSAGALFTLVGCNGGSGNPADNPVECTIKVAELYNVSLKYENGETLIVNDEFKAMSGSEVRLNIFRQESYKYEAIDFADNAGSPVPVEFNHEYVENSDKSVFTFKVPKMNNLSLSINGLTAVFAKDGLIYNYYDSANGKASVIGCLTKNDIGDDLSIPATVDYEEAEITGIEVDYVAPNALNGANVSSTKLHIGNNVETIGSYAFANIPTLETVGLEVGMSSLTWIGDHAFENDFEIRTFGVIPDTVLYVGVEALTVYPNVGHGVCHIYVMDFRTPLLWTVANHFVGYFDITPLTF